MYPEADERVSFDALKAEDAEMERRSDERKRVPMIREEVDEEEEPRGQVIVRSDGEDELKQVTKKQVGRIAVIFISCVYSRTHHSLTTRKNSKSTLKNWEKSVEKQRRTCRPSATRSISSTDCSVIGLDRDGRSRTLGTLDAPVYSMPRTCRLPPSSSVISMNPHQFLSEW